MKKPTPKPETAETPEAPPLFNNEPLRRARLAQEITYDQLKADKCKNPATLRQAFLGRDCRISTLLHLCKQLGVRVADLFPD